MTSHVQSVIFDRAYWSELGTLAWLDAHGFHAHKMHVTDRKFRWRQEEPLTGYNYRTIDLGNGIQLVIGWPSKR